MTVREIEAEMILAQKWCLSICDPEHGDEPVYTGPYTELHFVVGQLYRMPWGNYTVRYIRAIGDELFVFVWDESKFKAGDDDE